MRPEVQSYIGLHPSRQIGRLEVTRKRDKNQRGFGADAVEVRAKRVWRLAFVGRIGKDLFSFSHYHIVGYGVV